MSIPVGAPRTCKGIKSRESRMCVSSTVAPRRDFSVRCLRGGVGREVDVWVGVRGQRVKESSMSASSCAFYLKGVGDF